MSALPLFKNEPGPEEFEYARASNTILRRVLRRDGSTLGVSRVSLVDPIPRQQTSDLGALYDYTWLRSPTRPEEISNRTIRISDLFSGCGALSLGVAEACRALNASAAHELAIDMNPAALSTYRDNFDPHLTLGDPAETLVDGEFGQPTTKRERALLRELRSVDFLLGGPPCQGNSDLNNHTRRRDPKNRLMRIMARFAELTQPRWIVIENVPGVVHDREGVVEWTVRALMRLGYKVDSRVVDVSRIGVAQRRRRFVIAASRDRAPSIADTLANFEVPPRTLRWACEDLVDVVNTDTFNTSATHSAMNQQRMATLFRLGAYDLPDEYRPDCHRLKKHSYKAVYGRLRWDDPAPTLTSGFGSTGQGRFVHPAVPRTLTPHEASRVQFIPDFFQFESHGRVALQEMIGNAVPPKLAYALALDLMR